MDDEYTMLEDDTIDQSTCRDEPQMERTMRFHFDLGICMTSMACSWLERVELRSDPRARHLAPWVTLVSNCRVLIGIRHPIGDFASATCAIRHVMAGLVER